MLRDFQLLYRETKIWKFGKLCIFAVQYRGVEQLVARRAHNPEVGWFESSPRYQDDARLCLASFFWQSSCISSLGRFFPKSNFLKKNLHLYNKCVNLHPFAANLEQI